MAIPGLKVVVPSTPADMLGLLASAIRDPDPVIVFEHKALYPERGMVPDGEHTVPLGVARVVRAGTQATVVSTGLMVGRTEAAAEVLAAEGIDIAILDLRTLIPLDTAAILESVRTTGRLFTVEENPRVLGWGAEIASIVAEEAIFDLEGPIVRITAPHVPLASSSVLEDAALPSTTRISDTIRRSLS
jgi:pyruvate dehydrogenase E1 component beta subunit